MLYQDNYFVVSVKINFCQRLRLTVLMMKIKVNLLQILTMNSVKVKPQGKSSNQLPFHHVPQHSRITDAKMKLDKVTNTIKSNISEACRVQAECQEDSEAHSYDKNNMNEKVNEFVRLHKAMQEKLKTASYSRQIQIFTLLPDKWSQKYCSEYFNTFEYFL